MPWMENLVFTDCLGRHRRGREYQKAVVELKPYLYFVLRCDAVPDSLQQAVESIHCVWNGKYICQNFTLGADDEAIVLIF